MVVVVVVAALPYDRRTPEVKVKMNGRNSMCGCCPGRPAAQARCPEVERGASEVVFVEQGGMRNGTQGLVQ